MDTQTKKSGMGKKSIIIIAFLILVLVVIIASQKKSMAPTNTLNQAPAAAPTGNQQSAVQPPNDKMASINQDLQGVNLTDLENEFKDIDANLKNL